MKVLIINASPRRHGLISQMLDIMKKEAEQADAQVECINVNDLAIKPCTGCMACRKRGECVLPQDDAQRVLGMLQEADRLIVGAPCYWGNLPGQLKLMFDRMVYGMMEDTRYFPAPLMKGKRAVVVSTCTTAWPWNIVFRQTRGVVNALREILGYSGIKIVANVQRGGTHFGTKELTTRDRRKCIKATHKLLK
ncbi:MAG: flavodoxin family protein [Muribaculaceae bacterium]|nr:flavodoxin family protein [Muribaculaceae bacterium]